MTEMGFTFWRRVVFTTNKDIILTKRVSMFWEGGTTRKAIMWKQGSRSSLESCQKKRSKNSAATMMKTASSCSIRAVFTTNKACSLTRTDKMKSAAFTTKTAFMSSQRSKKRKSSGKARSEGRRAMRATTLKMLKTPKPKWTLTSSRFSYIWRIRNQVPITGLKSLICHQFTPNWRPSNSCNNKSKVSHTLG